MGNAALSALKLTTADIKASAKVKTAASVALAAIKLIDSSLQKKFDAMGGDSFFGPLVGKDGHVWTFQNGCLCYNSKLHAAFEIHGDIYKRWVALGGIKWGTPCTDETVTPDGIGRYNHFNDNAASIYWSPDTGAWGIWGDIRKKWAELGWETSGLGYPVTDETVAPDGVGRYNHFAKAGSIYWTPDTGAHAVWGEIRNKWESLGWERSYLGYPTSDEQDFDQGGRANSFQNGGIYWWGDTGAIDLRGVVVHYTGLYCFGETDWDQSSNSDEPYFIFGVNGPQSSATLNSQVYSDVDGGEGRPDLLELYRGVPYGLTIGAVLMENDFGDPQKYRAEIQKLVMQAHEQGVEALKGIPFVGPLIAKAAGPLLGGLMPSLGGAISDLLNLGDDRIGSANIVISGRQMVLLASRTANSTYKGIGFKIESPLISGGGASYKGYFGVVPA